METAPWKAGKHPVFIHASVFLLHSFSSAAWHLSVAENDHEKYHTWPSLARNQDFDLN
jgi:hypothetical protein